MLRPSFSRSHLPAGLIAAALSSASAQAAQCKKSGWELKSPTLCSKLFEFAGVCGRPNYRNPAWFDVAFAVGPWEQAPIRIFAVSSDATVRSSWRAVTARMFVGNSFNDDPMTPYATAAGGILDLFGDVAVAMHARQRFPIGMQLGGAGPDPLVPHLDVHMTCEPAGASYSGSMTVWYALDQ